MSNVEQRVKAYALASMGLILDDMIDDDKAKLSEDVKQEFQDYILRFPFSEYNGNDTTKSGDMDE